MHTADTSLLTRQAAVIRRLVCAAVAILLLCAPGFAARAAAPDWQFAPRRLGRALVEEGWAVDRTLTVVDASAEFRFPLQLVWHNDRTQRGLLGAQWFCPQLESTLLPRGQGVLAWTTPGGGVIGLLAEGGSHVNFRSEGGEWFARLAGDTATIESIPPGGAAADRWQYIYKDARLRRITAPSGRFLQFDYKRNDLVAVSLREPGGQSLRALITLDRDREDRLSALAVNGKVFTFAFERGRDGRLAGFSAAPAGRPGPAGSGDKFNYDANGVLTSIVPASGEPLKFSVVSVPPRDEYGKRKKSDPAAAKTPGGWWLADDGTFKYAYGQSKLGLDGSSITVTDQAGNKQSFEWNEKRGVETIKSAGQERVTYYYRAPGQRYDGKLRRIEANGRIVVDNRYDKTTGLLAESRDGTGGVTTPEYALGSGGTLASKTQRDLAARALPVRITRTIAGKKEVVASVKYDAFGRVVEKTDALGQTTRVAYNARHEIESITEPGGTPSKIARDAFGRPSEVASGELRQDIAYDEMGRVRGETKPDGQKIAYDYDARGLLERIKQNGVAVTTYERDEKGEVTAQLDALKRRTRFERDARGNLLAEHQPNGTVTRYEYDALNLRTAQIDGKGNKIEFRYDKLNRLVHQENPLGQTLDWLYDDRGRLIARSNGVQKVTYAYDEQGRLLSVSYTDIGREQSPGNNQKISYTYDEKGRTKTVRTASTKVTLHYDELSRIVAKVLKRAESERVLRYTWNARNQKTSVTLSESSRPGEAANANSQPSTKNSQPLLLQQTEWLYDAAGNLVELKSNGRRICRYLYDSKTGRLMAREYGNGIQARYAYDTFGRQTRLELSKGPLLAPLLLAYQWDTAGQLTSRTWAGEQQFYDYDPSGQLLAVRVPSEDQDATTLVPVANTVPASARSGLSTLDPQLSTLLESYKYDPAGNILEKVEHGLKTAMTYDAANQLATSSASGTINHQLSTINFRYDTAGRLVSEQSTVRSYGYLDKVVLVTKPEGERIGFDYYPDGQLAAKYRLPTRNAPASANPKSEIRIPKLTEEQVWDGLALLYRDTDPATPGAESFAIEPHVSGGAPVAMTTDPRSEPSYLINDILSTTLAVITPDRVQILPMTAFGKPLKPRSAAAPGPATPPLSPENDSPAGNHTQPTPTQPTK